MLFLKIVVIVVSTSIATLLAGGYFVYDRLMASAELFKKIDTLQLANKSLLKKHEDLKFANEALVKKQKKEIAELAVKHQKDEMSIKLKARAKAKIQRGIAAIPVVGLAASAAFEKMEFDDWKKDHPNGTFEEYSAEISESTEELLKQEYADFKDYVDQVSITANQLSLESKELIIGKYRDLKNTYNKTFE